MPKRVRPGTYWISDNHDGAVDEFVLASRTDRALHLEQMSDREWWLGVGEWTFAIVFDRGGNARVTMTSTPGRGLDTSPAPR